MSRFLSIVGVAITCVYMAALWWFFAAKLADIQAMPPNNIGDFLAGVFGPLAILWLILGFFQQGIELRQNGEALRMQAEELHNSVEQQQQLVEVSRRQLEAEIEAVRFEREQRAAALRPKFAFHGAGSMSSGGNTTFYSVVRNVGNTATSVAFLFDSDDFKPLNFSTIPSWLSSEERRFEWSFKTRDPDQSTILTISYIDAGGYPGSARYRFVFNQDVEQVA